MPGASPRTAAPHKGPSGVSILQTQWRYLYLEAPRGRRPSTADWLTRDLPEPDNILPTRRATATKGTHNGEPMRNLALPKGNQLIAPRPSSYRPRRAKGRANVMTMSWRMIIEFEPPMIACVVSNREHSFAALRATKECVIAIQAVELADKVVAIGNCSCRDAKLFEAFHLTPAKAERVTAPLIADVSPTSNAAWSTPALPTGVISSCWRG